MTRWFESGELRLFLQGLVSDVGSALDRMSEDDLLARSVDDLVGEFVAAATLELLQFGDEAIDGDVSETSVVVERDFMGRGGRMRATKVRASYEISGDLRLLKYRASQQIMTHFEAEVAKGLITVETVNMGSDVKPDQVKADLAHQIDTFRRQASYINNDVAAHNHAVEQQVRALVNARQDRVRKRRDLAGALGFPLKRRDDAPRHVPMERKRVAPARQVRKASEPYRDEPALTASQYEDAITVVRSTMLAMERTPSVASGKSEEELRDQILVQLNGTFTGGATGETFVQTGKTDILVAVEDRHVFVGECKWWTGQKACAEAINQLLGYLPWRNEKAALILFIDRQDASAVIGKAEEAIRDHPAFKRSGPSSDDPNARRNFVLGHPDDMDREIYLAALFAVLPKGDKGV